MKQQQLIHQIAADEDIFIQIRHPQQGIKVHIYSLKSQPRMKKFTNLQNFVQKDSLLKHVFKSVIDLVSYLRQPKNYIINLDQKLFYFNLTVQGKNYARQIKFPVHLMEEQLDPLAQNFILRKQIDFLKFSRKQLSTLKIEESQIIPTNLRQEQKSMQLSFQMNNIKSAPRASSKKIVRSNGNNTKGIQPQKLPVLLSQKISHNENNRTKESDQTNVKPNKIKKKHIQKKTKKRDRSKIKEKKRSSKKKQKINPKVKVQQQVQEQLDNSYSSRERIKSNSPDSRMLKQKSRSHLGQNIYQIKYTNGDVYKGQMQNNAFHGKGQYITEKYTLTVNWKDGEPDGEGVTQYRNGSYQKGTYGPGCRRVGEGQDHYANGQSYIGNFMNEKKNGLGIYHFQNGDYYSGEWKDDLQHGKGIQYFVNGSKFQGTWIEDEKHGQGILTTKHGVIKQIWNRGRLVRQLCQIPSDD